MAYTHASLFSGIGGAELAASWIGWKNVFYCEIQEFQRKVLEYWFPNSISYEDITKTDFTQWRGRIDVLTGGFPCQPFSVAGKRKGAEDNRYLWGEMLRAIRQIQPTWVVGENVAGLLSMVQPGKETKMGRTDDLFDENFIFRKEQKFTIEAICEDLEHAGYSVQPFIIPACAVGAPHRRDRVWIVAHRTDTGVKGLQQGGQDRVRRSIVTSNPNGNRQRKWEDKQVIEQRRGGTTNHCDGSKNGPFADTKGTGCTRKLLEQHAKDKSDGQNRRINKPDFRCFPTQSPICNRDDGLPFRVADLTLSFPQWRSKSIEALGNSWVPQVAYEIFKAIENYDKKK